MRNFAFGILSVSIALGEQVTPEKKTESLLLVILRFGERISFGKYQLKKGKRIKTLKANVNMFILKNWPSIVLWQDKQILVFTFETLLYTWDGRD